MLIVICFWCCRWLAFYCADIPHLFSVFLNNRLRLFSLFVFAQCHYEHSSTNLYVDICSSPWIETRSEISELRCVCVCMHISQLSQWFQSTVLYFYMNLRGPVFSYSHKFLVSTLYAYLFVIAILVNMRDSSVVEICISILTSDIDHLHFLINISYLQFCDKISF